MNRSLAGRASAVEAAVLRGVLAGGDALAGGHALLDDLGQLPLLLGGEQGDRPISLRY